MLTDDDFEEIKIIDFGLSKKFSYFNYENMGEA
jgi:hypothetical protein